MGAFFNSLKSKVNNANDSINTSYNKHNDRQKQFRGGRITDKDSETIGDHGDIETEEDLNDSIEDMYDENVGIQPTQKPESFHHFILENQYKDIERSIRGFKDVFNKDLQKWETKRKKDHCFTDEEAEEILRTAQSHLATDIKLSRINKEVFGAKMMAIYKRIDELFYSIAEYRYGRYGPNDEQYKMKLQNRKIFLELWERLLANYSRAIGGAENISTHEGVRGQESLQGGREEYQRDNARAFQ